jgi:hypothetical protein
MKHILAVLAAALATGFIANGASAQSPITNAPGYATVGSGSNVVQPVAAPATQSAGCSSCAGRSGFHPFARLFGKSGCSSCGTGIGVGLALPHPNIPHPQKMPPPPVATGGTLAFPNHTFLRSPRDFFEQ